MSPNATAIPVSTLITKKELDELLDLVFDDDAKQSFLSMTREAQLMAILGGQAYTRSKLASLEKRQIDFERDVRSYRGYRERRENKHDEDVTDTTQKIVKIVTNEIKSAFAQRFDFWIWFRDKVLPTVATVIVLGVLYLVFKDKLP